MKGDFLYSSPANGGNNVEHTHHDRKQKMQFALQPLASGIKMTIVADASGYEDQARDTTWARSPRANYILHMQP